MYLQKFRCKKPEPLSLSSQKKNLFAKEMCEERTGERLVTFIFELLVESCSQPMPEKAYTNKAFE